MRIFFSGILVLLMLSMSSCAAQTVNWKPLEAAKLQALDGKPLFVDIYTAWCQYCKQMDMTTFRNDSVRLYLDQHFHAMKFNGESRDSVDWLGGKYGYRPVYKANELTVALTSGQVSYPALIVIPAVGEKQVILGARSVREMELLLKYYGSRSNETMDFETFMTQFSGKW